MNPAFLLQLGLALIHYIPTIEASVKAATALVTHIHSVSDAVAAGEAIAEHLPDMLAAVAANTPADPQAGQTEPPPITAPPLLAQPAAS